MLSLPLYLPDLNLPLALLALPLPLALLALLALLNTDIKYKI
jgi:hypothetical protein